MRRPLILITVLAGLILAACAPSSGEPGSSQGQPDQTDQPAASQDGGSGGDGGGSSGANGSITFQITGDFERSTELPYIPILGGFFQQNGASYLPFAESDNANGEVVFIALNADGTNAFAYGNGTVSIPAAECDWNITRNDDGGAAGSFTCNDAMSLAENGIGTVDISGSFDAHD